MTAAIMERIYGRYPDPLPPHPTHCDSCGRELVYLFEQDSFRASTGEPIGTPTWRCPLTIGRVNRGLLLRHMRHVEYEPTHFFEWSWRKRTYR